MNAVIVAGDYMSNEELAVMIQRGDMAFCGQLWDKIERIVTLWVNRYKTKWLEYMTKAGVTAEDLKQEGYFAMLDAAEVYDSGKEYKFTTYLNYHIRNRFNTAVGFRTAGTRKSLLNNAKSLDNTIDEEEELSLMDMMEDETAEIPFNNVIEQEYIGQLHDDLECCINTLNENEQETIRKIYYQGKERKEIAEEQHVKYEKVRHTELNGLRKMKSGKNRARLIEYRNEIISRHGYRSSFSLWRDTGFSSTEYTAIELLEKVGRL